MFKVRVNTHRVLKLEVGPIIVEEGEENVFRASQPIGRTGSKVKSIWVFHGRDQGDRAEHDTEIYDGQVPLFLRSDHNALHFNAWKSIDVDSYIEKGILINILARSGRNPELNRSFVRMHWGIYLIWA